MPVCRRRWWGSNAQEVARGGGLGQDATSAVQEILPILIVPKDLPPFDPAKDEVMQGTRVIGASLSGHEGKIAVQEEIVNANL